MTLSAQALTDDVEFMKQYWFGTHCESAWTPGVQWNGGQAFHHPPA
jgi:hypothetical protein